MSETSSGRAGGEALLGGGHWGGRPAGPMPDLGMFPGTSSLPLWQNGKGPAAGLHGDPACVSAGSGGRTLGSSLRSSGTLYRKCPSHASSVTTPTSRRSRCMPSRPTTTHMTLWIAQPLISWISHPGPPGRIRGPDSTLPHCAVELPLATMPFQVDSVTWPLRAPYPAPDLLSSRVSLHAPQAHLAQAQGSRLAAPALPIESHILSVFRNPPSVKTSTLQNAF